MQRTEFQYEYTLVKGPGRFDLAVAQYRGDSVFLTVQQEFGSRITELWEVQLLTSSVVDSDYDRFAIHGMVLRSGPDAHNLTWVFNPESSATFEVTYSIKHCQGSKVVATTTVG